MAKKVKTVLNPCGLRVKKCCASCANKYIENDGLRACPVIDEYVESLCEPRNKANLSQNQERPRASDRSMRRIMVQQ